MVSTDAQSDKGTAWSELTSERVANDFDFTIATLSEEPETPVKEPPAPAKPDTTEPPAVPAPGPDEAPDGCPSEPGPCTW